MSMSSRKILELLQAPATGMNRGRAVHARLDARRPGAGATAAQRRFTEALTGLPKPTSEAYTHPATSAIGARHETPALTPADLMWLDRLPRDPAQASFDDARRLASMEAGLREGKAPASDRRLLASIWEPIRSVHDRKAAEIALRNAQQPLPQVPSDALDALVDAVSAETPELHDDEVVVRAGRMLHEALNTRSQVREAAIEAATRQLNELDAAQQARFAPTRD
jgi:hypothetical protein